MLVLAKGSFELAGEWSQQVSDHGERYLPLVTEYDAAMHLGHMSSYREALKYAYGRNVLDIGCGVGYGAFFLAYYGARHVTAMDVSPEALGYAAKVYYHPRLTYLQASGMELPFESRSFDFVFSSQVIEHIPSVDRFINEISRVLKDDGFCLIVTPNKDLFSPGEEIINPFHVSEMDISTFGNQMKTVFPQILMKGVPQHCLIFDDSGKMVGMKPNWEISIHDYQVQDDNLELCENLLCLGHVQKDGRCTSFLPDRLEQVVEERLPFFWDPASSRHAILGNGHNYIPTHPMFQKTGRLSQEFVASRDNLYRLQLLLNAPLPETIQVRLFAISDSEHLLAETELKSGSLVLDWIFSMQPASKNQKFMLAFDRPWTLASILRLATPIWYHGAVPSSDLPPCKKNGVTQLTSLAVKAFYADLPGTDSDSV